MFFSHHFSRQDILPHQNVKETEKKILRNTSRAFVRDSGYRPRRKWPGFPLWQIILGDRAAFFDIWPLGSMFSPHAVPPPTSPEWVNGQFIMPEGVILERVVKNGMVPITRVPGSKVNTSYGDWGIFPWFWYRYSERNRTTMTVRSVDFGSENGPF